jgi:hypothetical protein
MTKLREVNPAILKKRGRPIGVKNKPKNPIDDFKKTLDEWNRMDNHVNWEDVAKKQEQTINVYKIENEELAKICKQRWYEIEHLKYLITYLERKLEDASI